MNDMTKAEPSVAVHKSIAAALARAQSQMGKALKQSNNPHFKSKYADLSSVMDACMPSLTANGIAVIQPTVDEDGERFVKTVLIHGETGETLECRTPLIVQKNDMQGYMSAVTYGRRCGLMCMGGIAPEDDDGNAAVIAAPTARKEAPKPNPQTPKQEAPATDAARRDWLKSTMAQASTREKLQGWWTGKNIAAANAALPEPMRDELTAEYNRLFDAMAPAPADDLDGGVDYDGMGYENQR